MKIMPIGSSSTMIDFEVCEQFLHLICEGIHFCILIHGGSSP